VVARLDGGCCYVEERGRRVGVRRRGGNGARYGGNSGLGPFTLGVEKEGRRGRGKVGSVDE